MQVIAEHGHKPIKAWIDGVEIEDAARQQLHNLASLPFIYKHVAVMPDCHFGIGATVGSVIATRGAVVPAACGVDIGCGMLWAPLDVREEELDGQRQALHDAIDGSIPNGRTNNGQAGDDGAWGTPPNYISTAWGPMMDDLASIQARHPKITPRVEPVHQLGTLGTGNHFVEVVVDETGRAGIMLHSGSRGIGNLIGRYFIERAKRAMERYFITLPDADLAYLPELDSAGQPDKDFVDYMDAVWWAQEFAAKNRSLMLRAALAVMGSVLGREVSVGGPGAVQCHHNYIARENHYGDNVLVTRKGAVRARVGDLGIIPGAMGRQSFIVRGKGNPESFMSCSHGAGRAMSRTQARARFTVEQHQADTEGIACRKDASVLDETPRAYKSIEAVMAAQSDLVEIVHTLRAVVCVKG
jgi:tRNA-splicing ligase RtcB